MNNYYSKCLLVNILNRDLWSASIQIVLPIIRTLNIKKKIERRHALFFTQQLIMTVKCKTKVSIGYYTVAIAGQLQVDASADILV